MCEKFRIRLIYLGWVHGVIVSRSQVGFYVMGQNVLGSPLCRRASRHEHGQSEFVFVKVIIPTQKNENKTIDVFASMTPQRC